MPAKTAAPNVKVKTKPHSKTDNLLFVEPTPPVTGW
jgi:hypothetical protein